MPIYGFACGIEKVIFNGVTYTIVKNNGNLLIRDNCTGSTGVHTYGDWVTIKEAGCSNNGLKRKTCSVCGHTVDEEIPATGVHTWVDATCTTPKICPSCGATEGKALGHIWGEWRDIHPATCEVPGTRERICSRCGDTEYEEIPATGHDWDVEVEVVEPTCTEGGYTIHTCNYCGLTKYDSHTDPLGHLIVDGVCVRCGYKEQKRPIYYGVSVIPETYNSSFVRSLENQVASNSHLNSISTKPLVGEYIYYCVPASFGDCVFIYNNFVGGFSLIEEINFTNADGNTEAYNIYKSNQANLGVNGTITITIKKTG